MEVAVGLQQAVVPEEDAVRPGDGLQLLEDQRVDLHEMPIGMITRNRSVRIDDDTYCLPVGTFLGLMSFAFRAAKRSSIGATK